MWLDSAIFRRRGSGSLYSNRKRERDVMTSEEIFKTLAGYLEEMFEVPAEKITLDARLYEDLDLDSIDAVDLVVRLQDLTGKRIKAEQFKTVRKLSDVVGRVSELLAE